MEDLFGTAACENGTGGNTGTDCQLTTVAEQWMQTENDAMNGGHCFGFALTANYFFEQNLNAKDYGAASPIDLPFRESENAGPLRIGRSL